MSKSIDKDLPNKITIFRIILAFIVIVLLLFPFDMVNISFPKYLINGKVVLDIKLVMPTFTKVVLMLQLKIL